MRVHQRSREPCIKELAILSQCVYQEEPHLLPSTMLERGWEHQRTFTDDELGLAVAWYKQSSFYIVA
eukprot:CAMPEP_0172772644 /NCGR_PEP_ID=MMETSP1074-20121228/192758_1 /TAXON_ID=2916 /ORGANISM="Ceratium fusus, Strain PA161109" /LENGTH=66 /DNA_ID=CAMNT_0013608801 /DNA_START=13 /DNA_END=210 /DNA_ORIENTATION=-